MGRTTIRGYVGSYLEAAIGTPDSPGAVPLLSKVWPHPPDLADENDFYSAQLPGAGTGAQIFIYIGPSGEGRIALGGQHSGVKFRPYQFILMCYLRSTKVGAQNVGPDNDAFIDSLVAYIRADRNLGSAPGTTGAVGYGAVFQAGEGGEFSGSDLQVHSLLPRKGKGASGTTAVYTQLDLTVCELVQS